MEKNNSTDSPTHEESLEERFDDIVEQSKATETSKTAQETEPTTSEPEREQAAEQATQQTSDAAAKIVQPIAKANFGKYFLYTLAGGLIISAVISIGAVLVGEFNETMSRALGTTASMVAHTLVALLLFSIANRTKSKSATVVLTTLITITVASFITSVFGIWDIFTGRIVGDLYLVYFYSFCAVLWAQLLLTVGANALDKATRITSRIAVGFTGLFYLLLLPTVFTHYPDRLAEFHYRALAASVIALATASVLATVFHRIYAFKHPETKNTGTNTAWDIVIICVALFIGLPIIFGIISAVSSYDSARTYQSDTTKVSDDPEYTPEMTRDKSRLASPAPSTQGGVVSSDELAAYSESKDCSQQSSYSDMRLVATDYTLKSVNLNQKSMLMNRMIYGNKTEDITITWKTMPTAVDKDCRTITFASIKSGDKVNLYIGNDDNDIFTDTRIVQLNK